jgi:hypothetical protein
MGKYNVNIFVFLFTVMVPSGGTVMVFFIIMSCV